jgi:hypothetical protein
LFLVLITCGSCTYNFLIASCRGKKNASSWFDVSVSNAIPSTPTKSKSMPTTSSPGPVTRSQAGNTPSKSKSTATTSSPGPVTRSQAATTPTKRPAQEKKKKLTPKRKKLSDL